MWVCTHCGGMPQLTPSTCVKCGLPLVSLESGDAAQVQPVCAGQLHYLPDGSGRCQCGRLLNVEYTGETR